jgi:hypothetical protein
VKPAELKLKTCKECGDKFSPPNTIRKVCFKYECQVAAGIKLAKKAEALREKRERQALREAKERIKRRSEWIKEVQVVFNRFIRLRDKAAGHSCISSGRPLDWSGNAVDAGHYRSVGSAPHLRFDERNCHAQSKHDNQYKSGNAVDYRIGLIKRIGLEAVEALEADQTPKHYTIDELKELKKLYQRKCKELEKEKE